MERGGRQARRRARARDRAARRRRGRRRSSARSGSSPARSSRSARRSSSAQILFDKLGLSKKRRGKTGFSTDARVLQAIRDEHEIVPLIEDWRELTKLKSTYLDALPELLERRRPPAHHLQPDHRGHRPAVEHQPEPPEHPDPHRAAAARSAPASSPRTGARLISADYSQVELRAARPHRRRGGPEGDLPPRRGRAHRHRGAGSSATRRGRRPGHALEGEDGQLRDRLRPVGVRPRRPAPDPAGGGAGVHRPLPRALPGGQASSSTRRSSRPRERGLRGDAVRPHPPHPRAARAQPPDAHRSASGSPSTWSSRAPPPTSSRWRWCARRDARATPACGRGWCSRSTTSCCSRRPRTRSRQASEIVRREMAGAFELDPPLEVDVASASTGWRRSSGPRVAVLRDGRRPAGCRDAGADQLDARQVGRDASRRRSISFAVGTIVLAGDHGAVRAAASVRWARRGASPLVLPDRRAAGSGLRDDGAGVGARRWARAASPRRRSRASSRWRS